MYPAATGYVRIQRIHLTTAYSGRYITHAVVVTNLTVLVVRSIITSLGGIEECFLSCLGCGTNQCTASGGGNHFIAVERQAGKLSERTTRTTFVQRAECFGSIFEHRNFKFIGYGHNLIHTGRHAVEVHRNDGFRFLPRYGYAVYDSFTQYIRRHIPGGRLAAHKYRLCSQIGDGIGRCHKGKTLANHLITGLHTELNECQVNGCRTCTQCHNVFSRIEIRFQILLETRYIGTEWCYPVGIKRLFNKILLATAHLGQRKINSFVHAMYF